MAREPTVEKRLPNKFLGWEKVLHPFQPMVATRQIPPLLRGPRLGPCNWGEEPIQIPRTEGPKMMTTLQEPLLPTQELEVIQ